MFTIRTHCDGELLAEHTFDPSGERWGTLEEFNQVLDFTSAHYPDTSGITVDVFDESGTVTLSHTFA